MKKLATSKEINIEVISPFNSEILLQRDIDYASLSDIKFSKKYRDYLSSPAYLKDNKQITPFTDSKDFYKRGKSTSNSQKYQCKKCKKITNVLPPQEKSFNYHQQRNELLLDILKDILSRTPVKRTCEKLTISQTLIIES